MHIHKNTHKNDKHIPKQYLNVIDRVNTKSNHTNADRMINHTHKSTHIYMIYVYIYIYI